MDIIKNCINTFKDIFSYDSAFIEHLNSVRYNRYSLNELIDDNNVIEKINIGLQNFDYIDSALKTAMIYYVCTTINQTVIQLKGTDTATVITQENIIKIYNVKQSDFRQKLKIINYYFNRHPQQKEELRINS